MNINEELEIVRLAREDMLNYDYKPKRSICAKFIREKLTQSISVEELRLMINKYEGYNIDRIKENL